MEHRWGHRVPVDMDVQPICRPRTVGTGRLRNLSISGACVQSALALPALGMVRVVAAWPEKAVGRAGIRACVVRTDPAGLGLEWSEPAPQGVVDLLHGRAGAIPGTYRAPDLGT